MADYHTVLAPFPRPTDSRDDGGERAFDVVFQEQARALLAFARRLTRRESDAEDLLQETALLAFASYSSLQDESKARAWLFRILANRWKSGRRRFFRREFRDVPLEDALEAIEAAEPAFATERAAIDTIDRRLVIEALAELRAEMRQVLWLADVEGFTLREIAEIAGCAPGTAASRLARGRAALRARLGVLSGRGV